LEKKLYAKSRKTSRRSNAQLLRSIFDNAQIGTSFFSVEGREAFTNRAFQEMLGYGEEELSHLAWRTETKSFTQTIAPLRQSDMRSSSRGSVTVMNGRNTSFTVMAVTSLPVRGSLC
jgi:PAS domain S-box-containing protein